MQLGEFPINSSKSGHNHVKPSRPGPLFVGGNRSYVPRPVRYSEEIHADRKMRLLIMKDVRLGELMGRGHWWMTVGRIMRLGEEVRRPLAAANGLHEAQKLQMPPQMWVRSWNTS